MTLTRWFPVLLGLLTWLPAQALILVGKDEPVSDPGWPAGALAVANLKPRTGWMEGPPFGGGQWTFFYRGGTSDLQATVDAFTSVQADALEVVIHDGGGQSPVLAASPDTKDAGYDWSFEVWVPDRWRALFNTEGSFASAASPNFHRSVAAPRLDVWLRPDGPDWSAAIKLPMKLKVRDERATANGLPAGASVLRVHVLAAVNGLPLAGARFVATPISAGAAGGASSVAIADDQGVALLSLKQAGNYRLAVEGDGFAPRVLEYASLGTNDFKEFATTLTRAAVLRGVVRDGAGKPLSGVRIRPNNTLGPDGLSYPLPDAGEAVTDNEGHYELRRLPVGSLQVWAWRAGYNHVWNPAETIQIRAGSVGGAVTYDFVMTATGRVRIQIVDATGDPAKGLRAGEAQVHIEAEGGAVVGSWGGSSDADATGVVEFADVPPGRYRISGRLFLPGGQRTGPDVQVITVEAGKVAEAKLARP